MATIGGLSGSTSSGVNMYGASMKGYGGLATGMDTDSLIEGMTLGTRTKIQNMLKKKETYQWQTEAYRSVSDPYIKFTQKYLDIAKTNSPYRASFFDKNLATAGGINSKKVTVTGAAGSLLDRMRILGVSQLADDAKLMTKNDASVAGGFETGKVDFTNDLVVPNVAGGTFTLSDGAETLVIDMIQGEDLTDSGGAFKADYKTEAGIERAINAKLDTKTLADGTTKWSTKVKMSYNTGDQKFSLTAQGGATPDLKIVRGSTSHMQLLGFMDSSGQLFNGGSITGAGYSSENAIDPTTLTTVTPFAKRFADSNMTFNYNGVSKSIKLPSENEWTAIAGGTYVDKNGRTISDPTAALADYMQTKLDGAYGPGKISVAGDPNKGLLFNTTGSDPSAVLKIPDADMGLLGDDLLFEMDYGIGNRLNLNSALEDSGLAGLGTMPPGFGEEDPANPGKYIVTDYNDADGNLNLKINGVSITGLKVDSSLSSIISAINKSSANVKVSYLETADKFTIGSTVKGSAGAINIDNTPGNFAAKLFGKDATEHTVTAGQDAKMKVEYVGGVVVDVTRDSNSFSLDGSTFTVNEVFTAATNPDGTYKADEVISFSTSVDSENITKTIGEMIDEYNKIVDNLQTLVGTKPDRDYGPLTDDEKDQLSESQIEKLEKKAKEGILFNDSLLRGLQDKLRSVFSGVADVGTLKNMGITVGSSYKDGGKISFDPEKFKSALLEDPEKIKTLFTKPEVKDANGDIIDPGGITPRLKNISDGYVKWEGSRYGSLIDKAGSTYCSNSLLKNSLKTMMDDIDDDVKQLKKKLQVEIDRYTRQFSSLERLVAQMNSQSSNLASMMGG